MTGVGPAALAGLAASRRAGRPRGIAAVCSAHPLVLRAALRLAARTGATVLIEATCNQVNHTGGYTGLTPAGFAALVRDLARAEACPWERVVLGGDHLGPSPWRDQDAETALGEALAMVEAYVAAGFAKLHLDASMGCRGEPPALDDATTAERAVRLAARAEAVAREHGLPPPRYVIGTEVPPPGGADHALAALTPTTPEAARRTLAVHRAAFTAAGQGDALARVIALVVQPGVEFGDRELVRYDPARARPLAELIRAEPGLVYEAHSTDYQGEAALAALVRDGHQILKVGPELTFAVREALYALDLIAGELVPGYGTRPLMATMEALMLAEPRHWRRHVDGDPQAQRLGRHYGLADRIRYYWPEPAARQAVDRLLATLRGRAVPWPLWRQHLPAAAASADRPLAPEEVVIAHVTTSLAAYHAACDPTPA